MNLNELDEKKSKLIEEFILLSKNKKNDEILPLLLAVSAKAKKEKISFCREDISIIVNNLKTGMSDNEKSKLDKILEIALSI